MTLGSDRFEESERYVPGDSATATEQIREIRQPYATPRLALFNFPDSDACIASGTSPNDIASDLCEGDKLNLRPRVLRRLHEHCYLFDPERVWLRAISRCVYHGIARGVKNPKGDWLEHMIERTVQDLIEDDREDEWECKPLDEHHMYDYAIFIEKLSIPADRCRIASVRFNSMRLERRRILFRTVVDGWSLEHCEAVGFGPIRRIREDLRRSLTYISHASDHLGPRPEDADPYPDL